MVVVLVMEVRMVVHVLISRSYDILIEIVTLVPLAEVLVVTHNVQHVFVKVALLVKVEAVGVVHK